MNIQANMARVLEEQSFQQRKWNQQWLSHEKAIKIENTFRQSWQMPSKILKWILVIFGKRESQTGSRNINSGK